MKLKYGIDLMLVLISGALSFNALIIMPDFYEDELGYIVKELYPVLFTGASILVYLVITIFFNRFYNRYRWWIVGVLCAANLIISLDWYYTPMY